MPPPPSDADEDLWFLPGPPEDMAPTDPPWRIADRPAVFDVAPWLRAEAGLGLALADAAAGFARLDERLRCSAEGLSEHLALMEVADQLWAQGTWVAPEKLALYRNLRLSTTQDAQVLSAADWAIRRMLSRHGPEQGLAQFLGRRHAQTDGLSEVGKRPFGPEFARLEKQWWDLQEDAAPCHLLTQAAIGFYSWRKLGLSEPGAVLEPMAAVSGLACPGQNPCLTFLPVALGDKYVFAQSGSATKLLGLWYQAITDACQRAVLHLLRLDNWHLRAVAQTKGLSGRTPPALIELLRRYPMVSVDIAVKGADVSNASALRNLSLFVEKGLIREVTGQERYRFWTAAI